MIYTIFLARIPQDFPLSFFHFGHAVIHEALSLCCPGTDNAAICLKLGENDGRPGSDFEIIDWVVVWEGPIFDPNEPSIMSA